MENAQRWGAKKQMMELMQEGYPWQEAASRAGIHTSRSTAYRWFRQFRTQGEMALHDERHGHTVKMHQPIRAWLEARCREEPSLPSSSLQKELQAHFDVLVSITHLNRIRAAHGLERQPARMGKKSGPQPNCAGYLKHLPKNGGFDLFSNLLLEYLSGE
jgi:transposase